MRVVVNGRTRLLPFFRRSVLHDCHCVQSGAFVEVIRSLFFFCKSDLQRAPFVNRFGIIIAAFFSDLGLAILGLRHSQRMGFGDSTTVLDLFRCAAQTISQRTAAQRPKVRCAFLCARAQLFMRDAYASALPLLNAHSALSQRVTFDPQWNGCAVGRNSVEKEVTFCG